MTDSQECNVLLHALDSEDEEATAILRGMSAAELHGLARACDRVANLLHGVEIERCPGATYEARRLYWLNHGKAT